MALGGCAERPPRALAEGCELSTECASPLVCRLGACREECREARDCAPGAICVRTEQGLGACQLDDERECELASQCPEGLVCRFGQCTNSCVEDRDCINGLICAPDPDAAMQLACVDPSEGECRRNSDCPVDLICARDLRCREECRTDRDCRDGRVCDRARTPSVCMETGTGGASLPRPPPAASFEVGGATTCVVQGTTLACFGANAGGQVGTGGLSPTAPPTDVLTGAPILSLGVGDQHTCAITDALRCWGLGRAGQLGVPDAFTATPIVVPMAGPVIGVALGFDHTCAWSATAAHCWGRNDVGQLGDGMTATSRSTIGPSIDIGGPIVFMGAGEVHTCAVRDDGALFCWGRNDFGELGDETTIARPSPVLSVVTDVVEVAGGRRHTCALRADRTVRCFGENVDGQLGDGVPAGSVTTPVEPVGLGPVVQLTVGQRHTCVLEEAGIIKCFGYGEQGQLGTPTTAPSFISALPVPVPLPVDAIEVRAADEYTCARTVDGNIHCFGDNLREQFGDAGPGGSMPRVITP